MNPAIAIEHLTKTYGSKRGVTDLTFAVNPGEVFGYLGPNGAGKTTTIRQLLGFIRPTSGGAKVLGLDILADSVAIRRRVGYLPGELAMDERLTGKELLTYFANLRGGVDWSYALRFAERLDVDLKRRIRTLSKGNKQKVALVQAFMHRPDVLILDEPTSGLDPLVQQEFNRIVHETKAEGRTIFLSSHALDEVEALADRVGIIRDGRLVDIDERAALKARALREIRIEFGWAVPADRFAQIDGVHNVTVDGNVLRCAVAGSVDALIKEAAKYEVLAITSEAPNLERIFLEFYTGAPSHAA